MPLYKSLIFHLTVIFKFLHSSFQICLLFVPEMSASFTLYSVQLIYNALTWIKYPLHSTLHFDLKNLNILHQTMVYGASIRADLDSL